MTYPVPRFLVVAYDTGRPDRPCGLIFSRVPTLVEIGQPAPQGLWQVEQLHPYSEPEIVVKVPARGALITEAPTWQAAREEMAARWRQQHAEDRRAAVERAMRQPAYAPDVYRREGQGDYNGAYPERAWLSPEEAIAMIDAAIADMEAGR